MSWNAIKDWAAILAFTLTSGAVDAVGTLLANKVWDNGKFHWLPLVQSFALFVLGIGLYYPAVRLMKVVGIVTPELQVSVWSITMLVGVAIGSGKYFQWSFVDQIVGFLLVAGMTWLLIRTGG